jgi:hypothetical protein
MEATVNQTVREEKDAKTRLMNAKARAEAQKGLNKTVPTLKNINTGKEISTNVTKEVKPPVVKKEPKITIASKFDEILTKGGKWETLAEKVQAAVKELGGNMKVNIGTLKAHINFRIKTQKKTDYLGGLLITEEGIIKQASKKK